MSGLEILALKFWEVDWEMKKEWVREDGLLAKIIG